MVQSKVGFDTWAVTPTTKYINIGFRPKAIYFLANHDTGNTLEASGFDLSFGMTDTVSQVTFVQKCLDNTVSMNARKYHDDTSVMKLMNNSMVEEGSASLISIDDTGFTLDFTTVTGTAHRFAYMAWGGDDLLNTHLDSFILLPYVGGYHPQNINCGFQPSGVFFMTDWMWDGHAPIEESFLNLSTLASVSNYLPQYNSYTEHHRAYYINTKAGYPRMGQSFSSNLQTSYTPPNGYWMTEFAIMDTNGFRIQHSENGTYFTTPPGESNNRIYYMAVATTNSQTCMHNGYLPNTAGIINWTNSIYGKGMLLSMNSTPNGSITNGGSTSFGFVDQDGNQAVFYASVHKLTSGPMQNVLSRHGQKDDYCVLVYDFNNSAPYNSYLVRSIKFNAWDWVTPIPSSGYSLNQDYIVSPLVGTYPLMDWAIGEGDPSIGQGGVV